MKILSVVGVRKSGKTTTVEILIQELKKRGFRVGTVKTINCPLFELEENKKSNTLRHKRAGADVVCASARGETAFIYNEGLAQNEIFEKMQVDYLILEGDYQSDVPRIVCAHTKDELPSRINANTFLISGCIADEEDYVCNLPAVSALKEKERLVQKVMSEVPEAEFPVTLSPVPKEALLFCQHTCKKACARSGRVSGEQVPRHIFLTGEKQIGKSTIWEKVLKELQADYRGFRTYPMEHHGERRGFYMHAIGEIPKGYYNDLPVSVRSGERNSVPVTGIFETFGAAVVTEASKGAAGSLVLMDELGKMEKDAEVFLQAVRTCLDRPVLVLGVLQKTDSPFLQEIQSRKDVTVYEVTKENRDRLPEELTALIRSRM